MKQEQTTLPDRLPGRRRDVQDALVRELLKARALDSAHVEYGDSAAEENFFLTRLRARIRERQAQTEGGVWENAVLAARGWLLAFGVIASLLLAPGLARLMTQPSAPQPEDTGLEVLALTPHDPTGNTALSALEEFRAEASPATKEATHAR